MEIFVKGDLNEISVLFKSLVCDSVGLDMKSAKETPLKSDNSKFQDLYANNCSSVIEELEYLKRK